MNKIYRRLQNQFTEFSKIEVRAPIPGDEDGISIVAIHILPDDKFSASTCSSIYRDSLDDYMEAYGYEDDILNKARIHSVTGHNIHSHYVGLIYKLLHMEELSFLSLILANMIMYPGDLVIKRTNSRITVDDLPEGTLVPTKPGTQIILEDDDLARLNAGEYKYIGWPSVVKVRAAYTLIPAPTGTFTHSEFTKYVHTYGRASSKNNDIRVAGDQMNAIPFLASFVDSDTTGD